MRPHSACGNQPTGFTYESLEERIALSTTPPTVTDVSLASTAWTQGFVDHLESSGLGSPSTLVNAHEVLPAGYSIPVGSGEQQAPLPWNNLDQIRIRFSEDVVVDSADLSVSGVTQTGYAFSDFAYYPEVQVAVWTLTAPLDADRYLIDLDADGLDPVADLDGNVLDGDWTNSVSTFGSGNGVAGGDFEFAFNVLPGDALGIDVLDYNNLYAIYSLEGTATGNPTYLAKADIDGDGLIEATDWQTVWNDLYASTPAGTPAGVANDAPTTSGLGLTEITDDAIDVALSLYDAFDDAEDTDNQLSYAVVGNSDPSLFDSVVIDHITGQLIVNAASGVSGRAEILVSATDSAGLTTTATATIDVDRSNVAPTITATPTDGGGGLWIIEGYVYDTDDDLQSSYVTLTGLFVQRVSISEDGYYYFAVLLPPGQEGTMWATASDGVDVSNDATFELGMG